MSPNPLTADCKLAPYWWDRTPRPSLPQTPLPAAVDVAIVGSGYTGLHAALQTARGGRSTVVLDAEAAGYGCSTRNGGQISTSIKPALEELAKRYGAGARVRRSSGRASARSPGSSEFVATRGSTATSASSDASMPRTTPRQYDVLAKRIASQPKGLEVEAHMVPRAEQHSELGTDVYSWRRRLSEAMRRSIRRAIIRACCGW